LFGVSAPCPIYGFVARFEVTADLSDADATALTDDFLAFLEKRGLVSSGGFSGSRWTHVVRSDAAQATDADRTALQTWARTHIEIDSVVVDPLVDLDGDA
jgi:uncharacterized protein YggL (DUF469 family)